MLDTTKTPEEKKALIKLADRAFNEVGLSQSVETLVLLLAHAIWEDGSTSYRDLDKIDNNAVGLLDRSVVAINRELAILKEEYIEKRKLTDGILGEVNDLINRLGDSNIEYVLRGLEDQLEDAKYITPKITQLTNLLGEIYADIDVL